MKKLLLYKRLAVNNIFANWKKQSGIPDKTFQTSQSTDSIMFQLSPGVLLSEKCRQTRSFFGRILKSRESVVDDTDSAASKNVYG